MGGIQPTQTNQSGGTSQPSIPERPLSSNLSNHSVNKLSQSPTAAKITGSLNPSSNSQLKELASYEPREIKEGRLSKATEEMNALLGSSIAPQTNPAA